MSASLTSAKIFCVHCLASGTYKEITDLKYKLCIIKKLSPKWYKTRSVRWNIHEDCLKELLGKAEKAMMDELKKPGNFTHINFYRGR